LYNKGLYTIKAERNYSELYIRNHIQTGYQSPNTTCRNTHKKIRSFSPKTALLFPKR